MLLKKNASVDGSTSVLTRKRSSRKYWKKVSGNLYARLQYTDELGTPKEKLRRILEKKDAIAVVAEMRKELEHSGEETLRADRMPFSQLAELFIAARLTAPVYANGIKVSGIKSRIKPMVMVASRHFGDRLVRSIRPRDLETFKTSRLNTPVEIQVKKKEKRLNEKTGRQKTFTYKIVQTRDRSITTVNRELAALRMIFSFGLQNDWILQNPFSRAKGIIVVAAERERNRVLSPEEEVRLLAVCIDERAHIRPILICALDTAMRSGEMFKMKWREVNLFTGEIFIPQTNTKTERSRVVGMTPRLRSEIERLWEKSPKDPDGLVFGIRNTIQKAWRTACEKADVKDYRLHDCRHTATTRMVASGSPHTEVMKITGHSQMKTFLRYLNVTSETVANTANRLADYLAARDLPIVENASGRVN